MILGSKHVGAILNVSL